MSRGARGSVKLGFAVRAFLEGQRAAEPHVAQVAEQLARGVEHLALCRHVRAVELDLGGAPLDRPRERVVD